MIYDAMARHNSGVLSLEFFRDYIQNRSEKKEIEEITEEYSPIILPPDRFPTLREVEDYLFSEAMQRSEGNQSIAARLLGVSQSTLSRRFRQKVGE